MAGYNAYNLFTNFLNRDGTIAPIMRGKTNKRALYNTLYNSKINTSGWRGNQDYMRLLLRQGEGNVPEEITVSDFFQRISQTWTKENYAHNREAFFGDQALAGMRTSLGSFLLRNMEQNTNLQRDQAEQNVSQMQESATKDPAKDQDVRQSDEGDVAVGEEQAHYDAKNTLRPKFYLAGAEDVRSSEQETIQSNALFDAFSWVPDGYGLGPRNRLHLRNKQHDFIRFGMEHLAQPRSYENPNMPHPMPLEWTNYLPAGAIMAQFHGDNQKENATTRASLYQLAAPEQVLEGDYETSKSCKGLPRRVPSNLSTIYDNVREYLPSIDPPGMSFGDYYSFRETKADTWKRLYPHEAEYTRNM
jgi:hypothetical protein